MPAWDEHYCQEADKNWPYGIVIIDSEETAKSEIHFFFGGAKLPPVQGDSY